MPFRVQRLKKRVQGVEVSRFQGKELRDKGTEVERHRVKKQLAVRGQKKEKVKERIYAFL